MPTEHFTVPHSLSSEDAAARLLAGVPKLQAALPGAGTVDARRVGDDGMVLDISVMGQTITVDSKLTDTAVTGEVQIPMMLGMMKSQIRDMVTESVTRMLAKPA